MANFTRVKPLGWAANEKLTSAEMNTLDVDHAKSVNGDDGGTYNGELTFTDVDVTLHSTSSKVKFGATRTTSLHFSLANAVAVDSGYGTHWSQAAGGAGPGVWTNNVNSASSYLVKELPLPHGQTLKQITIRYKGFAGHGGSMPTAGHMPCFKLYRQDNTLAGVTQLTGAAAPNDGVDASANAGGYEVEHSISLASINHTINRVDNSYWIEIYAETDNFIGGAKVWDVEVTVDMTYMPEW